MSIPSYHSTKFFTENLLATEMRKTRILMNNQSAKVYQYYNKAK